MHYDRINFEIISISACIKKKKNAFNQTIEECFLFSQSAKTILCPREGNSNPAKSNATVTSNQKTCRRSLKKFEIRNSIDTRQNIFHVTIINNSTSRQRAAFGLGSSISLPKAAPKSYLEISSNEIKRHVSRKVCQIPACLSFHCITRISIRMCVRVEKMNWNAFPATFFRTIFLRQRDVRGVVVFSTLHDRWK